MVTLKVVASFYNEKFFGEERKIIGLWTLCRHNNAETCYPALCYVNKRTLKPRTCLNSFFTIFLGVFLLILQGY